MIRDHLGCSGAADPRLARLRLALGLSVLLVAAGFGGVGLLGTGFGTQFGPLSVVLGAVLGGVLLGEYLVPRDRAPLYQCLFCPAAELLTTYSLLGIALVAFHGGHLRVGAVSGLLLAFSFGAVVLTSTRVRALYDQLEDAYSTDDRRDACAHCGGHVDLRRAVPDGDGAPCHRDCWAEVNDAPDWFVEAR